MHLLAVGLSIAFLLAAEEADQSKQGNLSFSYIQLALGCFVFGNDAQRNADKGTEHPDERPLTLLDTKNVLTELTFPEFHFETEAKVDFPSACI